MISPENPEGLPTLPAFATCRKEAVGPLPQIRYVSRPLSGKKSGRNPS
jgi:hypothetical protein